MKCPHCNERIELILKAVEPYSDPKLLDDLSLIYTTLSYERDVYLNSTRDNVVKWRQAGYAVLKERGYSSVRIAKAFGRNHSTVLHGIKRAEQGRIDTLRSWF